ncbi:hypothetical protein D3C76_1745010 [compost metagenome]
MVDMTAWETDHVGNQAMFIVQRLIGFLIDGSVAMPTERFQRFANKLTRLSFSKFPFGLMQVNQFQAPRSKNGALRENFSGAFTQVNILDEFQTQ